MHYKLKCVTMHQMRDTRTHSANGGICVAANVALREKIGPFPKLQKHTFFRTESQISDVILTWRHKRYKFLVVVPPRQPKIGDVHRFQRNLGFGYGQGDVRNKRGPWMQFVQVPWHCIQFCIFDHTPHKATLHYYLFKNMVLTSGGKATTTATKND